MFGSEYNRWSYSVQFNIVGHPRIEPRHFLDQDIVHSYNKKYMFLGCIEFISKVCDYTIYIKRNKFILYLLI